MVFSVSGRIVAGVQLLAWLVLQTALNASAVQFYYYFIIVYTW